MPKFKLKFQPSFEAHQWFRNGDHPDDYKTMPQYYDALEMRQRIECRVVRRYQSNRVDMKSSCDYCGLPFDKHGMVYTLDGERMVCPSDWIVTGRNGIWYPINQKTFEQTYELVEDSEENT